MFLGDLETFNVFKLLQNIFQDISKVYPWTFSELGNLQRDR